MLGVLEAIQLRILKDGEIDEEDAKWLKNNQCSYEETYDVLRDKFFLQICMNIFKNGLAITQVGNKERKTFLEVFLHVMTYHKVESFLSWKDLFVGDKKFLDFVANEVISGNAEVCDQIKFLLKENGQKYFIVENFFVKIIFGSEIDDLRRAELMMAFIRMASEVYKDINLNNLLYVRNSKDAAIFSLLSCFWLLSVFGWRIVAGREDEYCITKKVCLNLFVFGVWR